MHKNAIKKVGGVKISEISPQNEGFFGLKLWDFQHYIKGGTKMWDFQQRGGEFRRSGFGLTDSAVSMRLRSKEI